MRALPLLSLLMLRLEVDLTSTTNASQEEQNKTFIRAELINYCNFTRNMLQN